MMREFSPEQMFGRYFRERQPPPAEQRREWISVVLCACATVIFSITKSEWIALPALCILPTAFMWVIYPEVFIGRNPGILGARICIGILHLVLLLTIVIIGMKMGIEKKSALLLLAIAIMIGEPILASILLRAWRTQSRPPKDE